MQDESKGRRVSKEMASAFVGVLQGQGARHQDLRGGEAKKLEKLIISEKMDERGAEFTLADSMECSEDRVVGLEGRGVLAVEEAINAALECVFHPDSNTAPPPAGVLQEARATETGSILNRGSEG
jgi:hypothetical protein